MAVFQFDSFPALALQQNNPNRPPCLGLNQIRQKHL